MTGSFFLDFYINKIFLSVRLHIRLKTICFGEDRVECKTVAKFFGIYIIKVKDSQSQ